MKPAVKTINEFIKVHTEAHDQLLRHCYFKLSNKELATDIVQESFARTWKYLSDGKKIENIKAFLFKVANNLIIDEYRKKKTVSLDSLQEFGFDAPFQDTKSLGLSTEVDMVLTHIHKLDEKHKEVLLLRYSNGFSPKEIAHILNESENAVSVRINRALKKVQKMLSPEAKK